MVYPSGPSFLHLLESHGLLHDLGVVAASSDCGGLEEVFVDRPLFLAHDGVP